MISWPQRVIICLCQSRTGARFQPLASVLLRFLLHRVHLEASFGQVELTAMLLEIFAHIDLPLASTVTF